MRERTAEFPDFDDEYVGRLDLLAQLRDAVDAHALTTIVGPGGAGKTRLATEVGRSVENATFVALAQATNTAEIIRSSARAMRMGGDASWGEVVETMTRHGALVVFDNVEQVIEDFAQVVGDLVGRIPLIVTSREPLRVRGEHILRLEGLAAEEARALFVERVDASGIATTGNVDALLSAIERLPLAIEIAAARMASMTVDEFVDRFRHTLSVAQHRRRDVNARHKTLHSAIQWSWDLLTPRLRATLTGLSLFEAPFTRDAAEAVLGRPLSDDLADLVDQSLLRFDRNAETYDFYVTVRMFVRTVADGREIALRRMVDYYIRDGAEDLENARGALAAAREAGFKPQLVVGLAVAVAKEMMAQAEIRGALQLLTETNPEGAPPDLHAARFTTMTHALQHQHRHEDAVRVGWQAVETADQTDDAALRARSRFNLAGSLGRLQRTDEALEVLAEAHRIAVDGGCRAEAEAVVGNRGLVLLSAGRLDAAEQDFLKVLAAARANELYTHEALTLFHLGVILRDRGGPVSELLSLFAQARRAADAGRSGRAAEIIERFTAFALEDAGRHDAAVAKARDTYEHLVRRGDEVRARAALMDLAYIERGARGIEHAESVLGGTRERLFREQILLYLAGEYLVLRDTEQSRTYALEGLQLSEQPVVQAYFRGFRMLAMAFEKNPKAPDELRLMENVLRTEPEVADLFELYADAVGAALGERGLRGTYDELEERFAAYHRVHLRYDRPNVVDPILRTFADQPTRGKILELSEDARRVRFGGDELDFSRRTTLRRLLLHFAKVEGVSDIETLLEAGWPGESMTHQSGLDRIYSAIRTLRKLGLDDVIETLEGGYRLSPDVTVVWT